MSQKERASIRDSIRKQFQRLDASSHPQFRRLQREQGTLPAIGRKVRRAFAS